MDEQPLKLFVSHPWNKYRKYTQRLIKMLDRSPLSYSNTAVRSLLPIQSADEKYLRFKIRERLKSSDVLIFVAGPWVAKSPWMQFEIGEALDQHKPVIAVRRHGVQRRTHEETELGVDTVGWNTPSIVSRLRARTQAHARASQARLHAMLDALPVERVDQGQKPNFWSRFFGTRH